MSSSEGSVKVEDLKALIQSSSIKAEHLVIRDTSDGCGGKFQIFIGSASFNGVGILQRHRTVNEIIKPLMNRIHAVEIKSWTLEEWEKKKDTVPQE